MKAKPNRIVAEGRKCTTCGAKLSVYNKGKTCWHHVAISRDIQPIGTVEGNTTGLAFLLTQIDYHGTSRQEWR